MIFVGHLNSPESIDSDLQHTIQAGGLASLKHLYPWHPAFIGSQDHTDGDDTLFAIDLRTQVESMDTSASNSNILRGELI